jgi:hypothetical protein
MGVNLLISVDAEADAEHIVDILSSELGFTIRNERD